VDPSISLDKGRGLKKLGEIHLLMVVSFRGKASGATKFGNHCNKYVSYEESPSVGNFIKYVRAALSRLSKTANSVNSRSNCDARVL
jgi:hypothetical protein